MICIYPVITKEHAARAVKRVLMALSKGISITATVVQEYVNDE